MIPFHERQRWTNVIESRLQLIEDEFDGPRGESVVAAGEAIFHGTSLNPLNALEIAIQIEKEFGGAVQEVVQEAVDKAKLFPTGLLACLAGCIEMRRDKVG